MNPSDEQAKFSTSPDWLCKSVTPANRREFRLATQINNKNAQLAEAMRLPKTRCRYDTRRIWKAQVLGRFELPVVSIARHRNPPLQTKIQVLKM
jgi:hypothetical protein